MYEPFYKLSADAFRLTPDARFCFAHASHTRAQAYLEYALKLGEGLILVTGRPGTGKTTLIDAFINQLDGRNVVAESIAASSLEATELLRTVAYAYGIEAEGLDKATLRRRIQQFFSRHLQSGRRGLLVIDEAQGLSHAAIEELRLLSDLHSGARPLLQLFLVGQDSLRDVMRAPEIEQFQQRVVGTCALEPLNLQDTRGYVRHRLLRAGWKGDPQFTGEAIVAIYRHSTGVPRHINKICTRLLLQGYMEGKHEFDEADVLAIAAELHEEQLGPQANNKVGFCDAPKPVPELKDGSLSMAQLALRADSESFEDRPAAVRAVPEGRASQPAPRRAAPQPATPRTRYRAPASPAQRLPHAPTARRAAAPGPEIPWTHLYSRQSWEVRLALHLGALVLVALFIAGMRTWFDDDAGDRNASFAAYSEMPASPAWTETLVNAATPDVDVRQQEAAQPLSESRQRLAAALQRSAGREVKAIEDPPEAVTEDPPEAVTIEPVPERRASATQQVASAQAVAPVIATTAEAPTRISQPPEAPLDKARIALADPVEPPLPQPKDTPAAHATDTEAESRAAETAPPREAEIEPAAPGQAEEQPPSQASVSEDKAPSPIGLRQQKIDEFLGRGRQALAEDRLLIPAGNNAHGYFREVLTLDSGNTAARDGIEKIVQRYALFAERALERHDEEKTRLYIDRGLRVRPEDKRLLALQGRLNTWLASVETEARQIMPELPPPPPPSLPAEPTPRQPVDFIARLKAFFSQEKSAYRDDSAQEQPGEVPVEDRSQPVSQRFTRD